MRGGQEQRGLKLSQIIKEVSYVDGKKVNCYVYREFGSKNRQGGFASLNMDNKVVRQHENTSGKGACCENFRLVFAEATIKSMGE